MFMVMIKEDTFSIPGMDFLEKKGFVKNKEYKVLGILGQKLLIVDQASGEMVELFPRNCTYIH